MRRPLLTSLMLKNFLMLGKILYYLTFKTFDFFCTPKDVNFWIRNSFYQNYFKIFNSDLDLTAYFNNDDMFWEKIDIIQSKSKFFFIIKEINYYFPPLLSVALKCINFWELKRDPLLIKKFSIEHNLNQSLTHSFVYLIRHLEASLKGKLILNRRDADKWSYHLKNSHYNLTHFKFNRDDLTDLIFKKISLDEKYIRAFNFYLNYSQNDENYYYKHNFKKELIVLFPHKLCYVNDLDKFQFSSLDLSIISSQLQWETWAMATQPWLFADEKTFVHMNNLIKMAQNLSLDIEIIQNLKEVDAFFKLKRLT